MGYHDLAMATDPPTDGPLSVADRLDAGRFFALPETAGEVAAAVVRRLDVGAALVYAIHDAGPAFVAGLPAPVRVAYARCRAVYGPDGT